jgi:hypothetical protein
VGKTLQDMRENGWESWVDAEGILWHASTFNGEGHVYSAGPRSGKQASYPDALKLASFRNIQNKSQEERPAAAAAAKAYIEKREQFKAARDAKKATSESDAESSGQKKAGRPKMTEEQKASAKAARAAKKAASESESEGTLIGGGGGSVEPKKKRKPLTEEQKAAAKAKRDAKKAATTLNLPGEWAELE